MLIIIIILLILVIGISLFIGSHSYKFKKEPNKYTPSKYGLNLKKYQFQQKIIKSYTDGGFLEKIQKMKSYQQ